MLVSGTIPVWPAGVASVAPRCLGALGSLSLLRSAAGRWGPLWVRYGGVVRPQHNGPPGQPSGAPRGVEPYGRWEAWRGAG